MEKPIARDWYEVIPLSDNISLIREKYVADWLRCNIWHVRGRDNDLIIDTGMGLRPLVEEVAGLTERPLTAIMTHSHFDHAGGLHQFDHRCGHRHEAQIIAEPTAANTVADTGYVRAETFTALPYKGFRHQDYFVKPAPLTQLLDEGDIIDLGNRVFKVFHMPGHSPGSIALFEEETGTLFSGDVVYDGDLLDTLYHSDSEQFKTSLRRVQELPLTTIHGGHYPSFGKQRLSEIVDGYLSGHQRIKDSAEWVRDNLS
jgi:glyoxylase-like metal-dependent hydrolase (beta-lactamase superfamily II)